MKRATVIASELIELIEAEGRRRGATHLQLAEVYADRFGVDPANADRALRRVATQDLATLELADRWCTALGLSLDDLPHPPVIEGRRRGGGHPAGVYGYLTDAQIRACHVLYEQGLSLRQVAARIFPRTRYASEAVCARALHAGFIRLDLPRRDRAEAAMAAHLVHGRARRGAKDPALRREQRRARGEVRDVRCAGIRTQYPRKGERCRLPAMKGGAYCLAHDPALAQERAERLAKARERLGRAA